MLRPKKRVAAKRSVEINDDDFSIDDDLNSEPKVKPVSGKSIAANAQKTVERIRKKKEVRKYNKTNNGRNSIAPDDEYEKVEKSVLSMCISGFNEGVELRLKGYPSSARRLLSSVNQKEVGIMKLILVRLGLDNEQCSDFFHFIGSEWHTIMSNYFTWADREQRIGEPNLSFVLTNLDAFLGLYNVHPSNPTSLSRYRLNPFMGADLEAIKRHEKKKALQAKITSSIYGGTMSDLQQDTYVRMMLLNISAYEPHCTLLNKLTRERKDVLINAWASYVSEARYKGMVNASEETDDEFGDRMAAKSKLARRGTKKSFNFSKYLKDKYNK